MQQKTFYLQLTIVSILTAALLFFLNRHPKIMSYQDFSWISLAVFIALSILMYNFGQTSAKSENKNNFTNTVLGFTVGKLFLAIIVIVSYNVLMEPSSKFFIVPFFVVYFIFTAFETYFMMKLGRDHKK